MNLAGIFVVILISLPATAQEKGGDPTKAPPRRVFTNESLQAGLSPSGDGLPSIPGLIKCGKDLKCFLPALDKGVPAAVTRTEIVKEGTGVITMDSTWWTTQCVADRCSVSFRVDTLEARVNDEVVPDDPKVRAGAEAKLAEMKRDFENIRGKTQTCSLTVGGLKTVMTSSAWSLVNLGLASEFGKNCSGPMFDAPQKPSSNGKK